MLLGAVRGAFPLIRKNLSLREQCTQFLPVPGAAETVKKKKVPVPRITLLTNDTASVSTIEEAQKLAKRRDLKLVKVLDLDTKTQRPLYRLMTGSEFYEADLKQREDKKKQRMSGNVVKGEKLLNIGASISEHDLTTYVNKIEKWLGKRYEVRVIVNGNSNMEKAEKIYSFMETNISKFGRVLQKRQKSGDIRFQILPPPRRGDDDNQPSPPS